MAKCMTSSEDDLMSCDEDDLMSSDEDLMSGDLDDLMSSDEDSEPVSTSIAGAPQNMKLITEESLLAAQREDLRKVMDILAVKEQLARTLLIHYRWDFPRLIDELAERGNEWLFSQAGVAIRPESTNSVLPFCDVCANDDFKEEETTMMDCGHTFCNECWTQHFLTQIDGGNCKRIKCMTHECNVICDEDIIRKLVTARDPQAAQRFDHFLFGSYIDDNNKVKWCPSVPNCGNAVRVEGDVYCEIQCLCGHQFCFNCLAQPHSPCSCLIWELWEKKCQDEPETRNWIAVNTKPCPKCGKNVQKDGGCNVVMCICGQYFCWMCGGAYERIDGHTCGRYIEDREKDIEKAQRDLKRYTHYYSRWKTHQDSLKLEAEQRELLEGKMIDLESKQSQSYVGDYSWLINALQRIFKLRRALSYSYPFAFHMFGDGLLKDKLTATEQELRQSLFEDQQQQLEGTVERLSKMIEGPEESIIANRMQIMNLCVVADTCCGKMYEYIQNDLLRKPGLTQHSIPQYNSKGVHVPSHT